MLKISDYYILDKTCIEFLKHNLANYIIYYYKENNLYEKGLDIYLHNDYLRVKYSHKIYKIAIIKKENTFYYYLTPFLKNFLIIELNKPQIFNAIIEAIINNKVGS